MAGKRINVGLIGCGGNMRGAHLPRIQQTRGVNLVAVADPSEAATDAMAEAHGEWVAVHTDYRKMLASEALDAVIISTPHNQHYAQAEAALTRGMHVLLEKPMTVKSSHAQSLLELAGRKRRVLHVAYQRHHVPEYVHVRNLLARGAVGELRAVIGYVTQNWSSVGGWRLDPEQAGGGMFMDTGSHLVASALYLSGLHVREVTALIDNAGRDVDINAAVSIRFDKGAFGSLSFNGNALHHDEGLTFHGDKGCIVIHQHSWRIRSILHNNEPLTAPKSIAPSTPDDAFFRWIRGAKGYERPAYALEVARISEAVYKSVATGKVVRVAG